MKIILDVQYFIATLLVLNIVLVNSDILVKIYYWAYKKLIKPKFANNDLAFADGDLVEIVYVMENEPPYMYFCLPLNKNAVIFKYHYRQRELKPVTDLLKTLR